MANPLLLIIGILILGISVIMFVGATPLLLHATDTDTGSPWENASDNTKETVKVSNNLLAFFPIILFIVGLVILIQGGK